MPKITILRAALAALCAPLFLAGCVFEVTPETVKSRSSLDLCRVIDNQRDGFASAASGELALNELAGRGEFSRADMALIRQGKVQIGMGEDAAICAWPYPARVNRTTTANRTSNQYVYVDADGWPRWFIYTTNGRVTAIQD